MPRKYFRRDTRAGAAEGSRTFWRFLLGRHPIIILLLACGCATTPKKAPYTAPTPASCGDFSNTIKICAAKAHHKKMGAYLVKIARCETGNKCTGKIDSPTGLYHGPFQFLTATWDKQCHPIFDRLHMDQCSSKSAIYDTCCAAICASQIIAQGGRHNWPVCGKPKRAVASP